MGLIKSSDSNQFPADPIACIELVREVYRKSRAERSAVVLSLVDRAVLVCPL